MNTHERADLDRITAALDGLPEADIAWFAGWLSADGSIYTTDSRARPAIRFCLTDRDPLDRFSEMFGNRVCGPFEQSSAAFGTKPIYEWKISGSKAVAILERCMPWLSKRYAERARQARKYTVREHSGRILTPTCVIDIKKRLRAGEQGRGIARKYGVAESLISHIKTGRLWGHIAA